MPIIMPPVIIFPIMPLPLLACAPLLVSSEAMSQTHIINEPKPNPEPELCLLTNVVTITSRRIAIDLTYTVKLLR